MWFHLSLHADCSKNQDLKIHHGLKKHMLDRKPEAGPADPFDPSDHMMHEVTFFVAGLV